MSGIGISVGHRMYSLSGDSVISGGVAQKEIQLEDLRRDFAVKPTRTPEIGDTAGYGDTGPGQDDGLARTFQQFEERDRFIGRSFHWPNLIFGKGVFPVLLHMKMFPPIEELGSGS